MYLVLSYDVCQIGVSFLNVICINVSFKNNKNYSLIGCIYNIIICIYLFINPQI